MMTQEEMDEIINMIWPTVGIDHTVVTFGKANEISHAEYIAKKAYEAQQMRKSFEAEERRYMDELKALAGGESATWGNYMLIKERRLRAIDYGKTLKLQSVKLEDYRRKKRFVWKLLKTEE